jgi:hypothetical protein
VIFPEFLVARATFSFSKCGEKNEKKKINFFIIQQTLSHSLATEAHGWHVEPAAPPTCAPIHPIFFGATRYGAGSGFKKKRKRTQPDRSGTYRGGRVSTNFPVDPPPVRPHFKRRTSEQKEKKD